MDFNSLFLEQALATLLNFVKNDLKLTRKRNMFISLFVFVLLSDVFLFLN